jgi:hypothetical protein
MSLAAALRASNPSQPNTVTEIKYNSLNSTALDHGQITGTKETPGHLLCDEFWHGTGLVLLVAVRTAVIGVTTRVLSPTRTRWRVGLTTETRA